MTTLRKGFTPIEFKLSEAGEVTVAFSRFNVVDSDEDVTFAGSMPVGKAVPMSAYGHTSWDGALPTGKGVISESGDLGVFEGGFFMETDQGRNAYNTVKAMADIQEWSYGYAVLEGGPGMFEGKRVRELRKLDVFEVSPVLKGAGIGTATLALKSGTPGTDAPWAERLSWYVDGLTALLDHGKARHDMRVNEGRKLSRSDRARLEDLRDALRTHLEEVDGLLIVPEDPKAVALRASTIDVLLSQARAAGVPIPA